MEEIQVVGRVVRNPSFTDYLIPTILDMPPMRIDVLERPDPHAPYGLRGVGEPPTISSTPAIVAAIRAAREVWSALALVILLTGKRQCRD
jgi:CO/xanthine dehydrogenase Mo-binding subunit